MSSKMKAGSVTTSAASRDEVVLRLDYIFVWDGNMFERIDLSSLTSPAHDIDFDTLTRQRIIEENEISFACGSTMLDEREGVSSIVWCPACFDLSGKCRRFQNLTIASGIFHVCMVAAVNSNCQDCMLGSALCRTATSRGPRTRRFQESSEKSAARFIELAAAVPFWRSALCAPSVPRLLFQFCFDARSAV
jgi:hypothetical protein